MMGMVRGNVVVPVGLDLFRVRRVRQRGSCGG
jgi:hypothetical protein